MKGALKRENAPTTATVVRVHSTRAKGPKLGVAKSRKVKTAGGRVGQWWTPPWLAKEFARWCGIRPGMRVIDAGAGLGALTIAALERGAVVTAVEIDPRLVEKLTERFAEESRVTISHSDFLARDRRQPTLPLDHLASFSLAISNPVWEGDMPEQTILRALEIADRAALIVPLNMLCGGRRKGFWECVEATRSKALPHRPRFLGAKGGMRDVMFIEVRRRLVPSTGSHVVLMEVG